jgi:hypothetical protein
MFRFSRNGQELIVDVDQVDPNEPAIRLSERGRYHVDEISADPLPVGTARDDGDSEPSTRRERWRLSQMRGMLDYPASQSGR